MFPSRGCWRQALWARPTKLPAMRERRRKRQIVVLLCGYCRTRQSLEFKGCFRANWTKATHSCQVSWARWLMATSQTPPEKLILTDLGEGGISDFSLVLGGPLYQVFRKAHLEGDHRELLYRRIIVIAAIAWLPLALLAAASPYASSASRLAFVRDIEVHPRFLIALPLLVL